MKPAAAALYSFLLYHSLFYCENVNAFSVPLSKVNVFSSRRAPASPLFTVNGSFSSSSSTETKPAQPLQTSNNVTDASDKTFDWTKQWYPVLPMSYINDLKLDETPFAITLLDEDLVIWKTAAGEYSILQDICPHRRAQLSTGKIYNDTLACRYHGWEFDKEGACAKIPMMPNAGANAATDKPLLSETKAFCVNSYPTQTTGGLLWVYMNPSSENNPPPPLSPDIVNQDSDVDTVSWSVNSNPLSWQSMIENAFDPSHAAFTHEGPGFGRMPNSPSNAIPIEEYEFTGEKTVSKAGFALRHTPYQLMENAPPGAEKVTTTREFVAPITTHTKGPIFKSTIYFVPVRPGETLTIFSFQTSGKAGPKMPLLVQDAVHFFLFTLGDGIAKFINQDRIIMQAQDRHKSSKENKPWEDMYPTKSDTGVKAMQSWTRKFGRPLFIMPHKGGEDGRQMSVWDRHAKYCPSCHRSIRRVATVEKKGMMGSNVSFFLSVVGVLVSAVWKKASASLLKSALGLLILSMGMRYLSSACSTILERVFVNPNNLPKYRMMDVYAK